jgi:hypothetical protein
MTVARPVASLASRRSTLVIATVVVLPLVVVNAIGPAQTWLWLVRQAETWPARSLATAPYEIATEWNIGPSRVLGAAWVPIGVGLATLLATRGWRGLASVAISPYVFPYYLLLALLDLPRALDRIGWDAGAAVATLRARLARRAWQPVR